MKSQVEALRDHLFDVIDQLKNKENPMDVARAKAVADVAQTIINTAKAELDFIKTTDAAVSSRFFPEAPNQAERLRRLGRDRA